MIISFGDGDTREFYANDSSYNISKFYSVTGLYNVQLKNMDNFFIQSLTINGIFKTNQRFN